MLPKIALFVPFFLSFSNSDFRLVCVSVLFWSDLFLCCYVSWVLMWCPRMSVDCMRVLLFSNVCFWTLAVPKDYVFERVGHDVGHSWNIWLVDCQAITLYFVLWVVTTFLIEIGVSYLCTLQIWMVSLWWYGGFSNECLYKYVSDTEFGVQLCVWIPSEISYGIMLRVLCCWLYPFTRIVHWTVQIKTILQYAVSVERC